MLVRLRFGTLGPPAAVLLAIAAAGPAACGGKVSVDDEDASSASGNGGAGASTSSSSVASVGPTGSSGSSSSVSSATAGGAPVICEDDTTCGDCVSCANSGPCFAQWSACETSTECADFQDCTVDCQEIGPEACLEKCATAFPTGWALYSAWLSCGPCSTCFGSCEVAFSFYCVQPL